MQQVAREFNFSESTFVLPAGVRPARAGSGSSRRRPRCRSPAIPTSGRPSPWPARASSGRSTAPSTVTFEEKAGLVDDHDRETRRTRSWCELAAPERLSLGTTVDPAAARRGRVAVARTTSSRGRTRRGSPRSASRSSSSELADRGALERARTQHARGRGPRRAGHRAGRPPLRPQRATTSTSAPACSRRSTACPRIPRPAARTAPWRRCSAHCDARDDGDFGWRIAQGVEMGRPSVLEARAEKKGGGGRRSARRSRGASVLSRRGAGSRCP